MIQFKVRNVGSSGDTEEILVSRSPHLAGPPIRFTVSTYGADGPSRAVDTEITFDQAEALANHLLEMVQFSRT